jgi:DNA-directed RNA polymerase subunit F
MKKKNILFLILSITLLVSVTGCKKQDDFLNVKRNLSDVKPSTLKDFQAILDNNDYMNQQFPSIGFVGTDNIHVADDYLAAIPPVDVAAYLWKKDIYQQISGFSLDWDFPYGVIEHTNIVLDGLSNLSDNTNQEQYRNIKGAALFYRTFMFYCLAQDYCKSYQKSTASTDLGIVLRLTSDVNQKSHRSTVQQTYDQMINDLKLAIPLLPITPAFSMRPSQPAANALLAKIYLSMGDYSNAELYATNSLNQFNTLLDFNSNLVQPSATLPFPQYPKNPEVSFFAYAVGLGQLFEFATINLASVDTDLYDSYDSNDLRKTLYYTIPNQGLVFYRGSFTGSYQPFSGIATNEVYIIRSECYARLGKISQANSDLNTLLSKRYKTGTFSPINIQDVDVLLSKILLERRKELAFTGQMRWEDLRRLNTDSKFAITLQRTANGVIYTLPPNDPRYVLPIPDAEIQLSGIQQNQR